MTRNLIGITIALILSCIIVSFARAQTPYQPDYIDVERLKNWQAMNCTLYGCPWNRYGYVPRIRIPDPKIMDAQVRLQRLGYEVEDDGFMGPETRQVVRKFQRDHDLEETGEFGPRTLALLYELKGERSDDRRERRREDDQCLAKNIDAMGGQHNTESKSKSDAQRQWMLKVQARIGSVYMNFLNAVDIQWRCFQSQSHDTFLGKVQSGTSKILGGEGYYVVCEVWARPCAEPVIDGKN